MNKNILKFIDTYGDSHSILSTMLKYCVGSPEHPVYHPEGTLDAHIDIVLERAFEKPENKELHFAAMLHDICKHGYLDCIGRKYRVGKLKTIDEGSYWQNVYHATHAVEFIELPLVTQWILSHDVDIEKVKRIVGNHMKMKNVLAGEKGKKGGMKKSKRDAMQNKNIDIWDDMYYFSNYCDNMLRPKNVINE